MSGTPITTRKYTDFDEDAAWERRVETAIDTASALKANFISADDLIESKLAKKIPPVPGRSRPVDRRNAGSSRIRQTTSSPLQVSLPGRRKFRLWYRGAAGRQIARSLHDLVAGSRAAWGVCIFCCAAGKSISTSKPGLIFEARICP